MEERGVTEAKRRMSAIAAEAANQVEDHEAHDDEGSSHVIPEWQVSHRRRGSSIAMDAANLINNKKEVCRKGSIVAADASKVSVGGRWMRMLLVYDPLSRHYVIRSTTFFSRSPPTPHPPHPKMAIVFGTADHH